MRLIKGTKRANLSPEDLDKLMHHFTHGGMIDLTNASLLKTLSKKRVLEVLLSWVIINTEESDDAKKVIEHLKYLVSICP